MDLFKDILPSIMQNKKYVLEEEKDYTAFIINKTLSYHPDCILDSNMMNFYCNLDNAPQYQFYLNNLRSMKRPFVKWEKPIKENDLLAVKLFFGYSDSKAVECLKILTEDQLQIIRTKTSIGD
jgi:hypothetical protein